MRSIKPGRGPSMMSGVVGIFMVGFGILWTCLAAQASGFMALFGVLWTGVALTMTVYNFKNATGKNRYSEFDITEEGEEPDPFNERFGVSEDRFETGEDPYGRGGSEYCPYCGTPVDRDFRFCNKCGRELP